MTNAARGGAAAASRPYAALLTKYWGLPGIGEARGGVTDFTRERHSARTNFRWESRVAISTSSFSLEDGIAFIAVDVGINSHRRADINRARVIPPRY